MNKLTLDEFKQLSGTAKQVSKLQPYLRLGQAMFNAMVRYFPKTAEEIRGTDYDMYHVDENIIKFKKKYVTT